ncbi:MAG: efflux RND transporter periplasmic adaptor subunit [Flavobacteriales bacterium]|nr:efflux RND transporter periplasmic adaptor subunit [Flavobacteriales bacterium]
MLSDSMLGRITLDTVRVRPVENLIELNGRIAAAADRMADIYAIVGGQVLSVEAELGDRVTKGQTLAIIRSSEVAQFESELIDARSDVRVAQKNLQVQQDLFATKLISERELVLAQQDLAKAEAQLRRVEEVFSIYHFRDGSVYEVKAPISGYLIDRRVNRDVVLPANQNERIFSIAELDEVWVLAEVYESDIARVKEGLPAEITTLSYRDRVFPGTVDKIFNILDPRTRTMRVRVKLQNPETLLKPEMIARVRLTFEEDQRLPAIPGSAIISDNGKQYVMVYQDRRNIATRQVRTLRTTGSSTWITEGLASGEVIISKGQLFIYDALNDR